MSEYGVFRKIDRVDVCYGGPFNQELARVFLQNLQKQTNFVNEEELKSRKFEVKLMKQGVRYLYSDGIMRPLSAVQNNLTTG
jgi:hypothetical protein